MKLNINLKVSDMFGCTIQDDKGKYIVEDYCDYVPDFMPGQHFGDYVELEIDTDTGQITNWTATKSQIKAFIKSQNEVD